jgi:carboxypeptidase Taq
LGCIQDVHWTRGSVGYFSTYSMGNLIGAQIWSVLRDDLGDTDEMIRNGDFGPILGWLRERIYSKARLYSPKDLVTRVTGRPMEAADWLRYATHKYESIYGLERAA